MRPGTPSYFYSQQQQQPQGALHFTPGYPPVPVQQIATGAPFRPSLYGQSISNGLQQYVGLPIGGGNLPASQQRGMLLPQDAALLQQPWNYLPHESQVWGSSGLSHSPQGLTQGSTQGLFQPPLIQHVSQQQQAYRQDLMAASVGRNGSTHPEFQGADRVPAHAFQPFMQSNDTTAQFGMAAMGQGSRMQSDGMQSAEGFRGNIYGNGQSNANGKSHIKPYENDHRTPGKWSRGGANHASSNSRLRGGKPEKSRGGDASRSKAVVLRCDPCAKTFTNAQQSNAHFSTHSKCDAEGCSFEASGRILKEHRQMSHGISSEAPTRSKMARSTESEEELKKWREERRVNYPTTANILRKAEEVKAKRLRGELVDEDSRKRRERLREILARQAELGVPVAEVPSYYMSDHSTPRKTKGGRLDHTASPHNDLHRNGKRPKDEESSSSGMTETIAAAESCAATPRNRKSGKRSNFGEGPSSDMTKLEVEEPEHKVARTVDASVDSRYCQRGVEMEVDTGKHAQMISGVKEHEEVKMTKPDPRTCQGEIVGSKPTDKEKVCIYFMRGRCKKGNRCEYLHERRPKKKKEVRQQPVPRRTPTLLGKLLESDVRREKSHLLQAFRFFVNNIFLLEFPDQPLKFFDWQKDIDGDAEQRYTEPLDIDAYLQAEGLLKTVDVVSGLPMEECEIQRAILAADSEMHAEDEEDCSDVRESPHKD